MLAAPPGELRLGHVRGVPGLDLIEAGLAAAVLRTCGDMLRRVQVVDVAAVVPGSYESGSVLVHGDYGPNNMLFTPDGRAAAAVLDWEWAHAGGGVEDLAWCEWIVRRHLPAHSAALPHLFDGYGACPPWPGRHAAMLAKCRAMLAAPRPEAERATARAPWTRTWT